MSRQAQRDHWRGRSSVALTYTAILVVGLAAQPAGQTDLIRSPTQMLAHTWEGLRSTLA